MDVKFLSRAQKKRKQRNDEIVSCYRSLRAKGVAKTECYNRIAEKVDVSYVTVYNVIKMYNLKF